MEKDMRSVNQFENKRRIEILAGQSFNNAVVLLHSEQGVAEPKAVFELARRLFDEALKQNFLSWSENSAKEAEV